MKTAAELGFTYTVDVLHSDGSASQAEVVHNLIPDEGLAHAMGVIFKSVTPAVGWFVALYHGNYTPTPDLTAATFPALATEWTTYVSATRPAFTSGAVSGGALDNSASPALFVSTADNQTIYGGVLTSSSAKGATTGALISAVRFTTPKVLGNGDTLRVTAGNSLTSA